MKKVLSLFLVIVLIFSLTACGKPKLPEQDSYTSSEILTYLKEEHSINITTKIPASMLTQIASKYGVKECFIGEYSSERVEIWVYESSEEFKNLIESSNQSSTPFTVVENVGVFTFSKEIHKALKNKTTKFYDVEEE